MFNIFKRNLLGESLYPNFTWGIDYDIQYRTLQDKIRGSWMGSFSYVDLVDFDRILWGFARNNIHVVMERKLNKSTMQERIDIYLK